jgi:hypothetical protein
MTTTQSIPLAVALVKSTINWTWHLRIDDNGLYRWYLDGTAETELRGCTRSQAEYALRRFVEQSFRGDVEIVEVLERITVDHESSTPDKNLKETA